MLFGGQKEAANKDLSLRVGRGRGPNTGST